MPEPAEAANHDPSAYDDAMFEYSTGDYTAAEARFRALLNADPSHFDARLGLAMCLYRQGNFNAAIAEGKEAQALRPAEQEVHTNLSLFYMKAGDKTQAEYHGLQAKIAGWKKDMTAPKSAAVSAESDELAIAKPKPQAIKVPERFPDMPWKKNRPQPPAH